VAADLGTTVTASDRHHPLHPGHGGIMITGGKIGALIGRRRAFGIGLVV